MLQTVADTLKLVVKEGLTPDGADKFLFNLAPFVVLITPCWPLLLLPCQRLGIWDINIGILYVSPFLLFRLSHLNAGWPAIISIPCWGYAPAGRRS